MLYQYLVRPLLFAISPETIHGLVMGWMRALGALPGVRELVRGMVAFRRDTLELNALGLRFRNPIGLAAGMDKDAAAFAGLDALGFGFIEVGTLTAQPQPGNPQPRLFRLPLDRALINRMGFNNGGAQAAAHRLARRPKTAVVLGVNIGKSRAASEAEAAADYARSAELLAPYADYLAINVSSPNTPGLRDLQAVDRLRPILLGVQAAAERACSGRRVPLLVKIAPDLADPEIDAVADLALELKLSGIIAVNTTIGRQGLRSDPAEVTACGPGGLSGPPLRKRAVEVIRRLRARVSDQLVLISVGGIETADDAWERICAGATLVQIYTAFVYGGPLLPRTIAKGLAERVREAGLRSISEAIGRDG